MSQHHALEQEGWKQEYQQKGRMLYRFMVILSFNAVY